MHSFVGSDLNDIYLDTLISCQSLCSQPSTSRAGDVYDFGQAYFEFVNPVDQILTLRNRGFNPYFAIVEAAWILSGKNSLAPLKTMIANYSQYSDDGKTLNGAYGFRMKRYFGQDQLSQSIDHLKATPSSRRAVLTLYSPEDLNRKNSLDIPCNTTIYLKIRNNKLDITVLNRSNDLFMGIPYNIFVFNCVQKYIANHLDLDVGAQRHFTDSLHLYKSDIKKVERIIQTNHQHEILSWKEHPSPIHLYKSILSEHDAISEPDLNNIQCPYTRKTFSDYFTYKANRSSIDLIQSLPYDKFGLSVKLWIESLNQKAA
ncbi:thymidylate synthase [Pseudomonas helleri]|uniref:thymidylate synthase n=1 Tax=Pseudomonas helleri TaxID=1608996 RepID=UPI0021C77560|nr:thymidylate synthase [Pseudomonas helleri]MCU1755644.1 thymidylate synthase [Pseudomonas helleri]